MKTIRPITLEIEEVIWKEFKSNVTRDQTLNDKIVELIKKFNEEKNNGKGI